LDTCSVELGCDVGTLLTPLTRFSLREPERPWAIDNGAYARFDAEGYWSLLLREDHRREQCLFVTAPDVVGSARRTLELFRHFQPMLSAKGWNVALVAQDGQESLPIPWHAITAIFIGGTTSWKLSDHAKHCIKAGKALGKWVHVGRVNDPTRFDYFEKLGADSIDGTGISRYSHMREAIAKRDNQEKLWAL